MTRKDFLTEKLDNWFEEQSTSTLVTLHNKYCEAVGYDDDIVYDRDTYFEDLCCGMKILDVIDRLSSNFDTRDDYVYHDGYGNISSTSSPDFICIDDVVNYIIENDDDLEDEDIRDMLDEAEEDEEESEDEDEE